MKPETQVIFFTPYPQDKLSIFRTTGPSKRAGGACPIYMLKEALFFSVVALVNL
jgi:hypothetical protein